MIDHIISRVKDEVNNYFTLNFGYKFRKYKIGVMKFSENLKYFIIITDVKTKKKKEWDNQTIDNIRDILTKDFIELEEEENLEKVV